jgi:hypothetical protein
MHQLCPWYWAAAVHCSVEHQRLQWKRRREWRDTQVAKCTMRKNATERKLKTSYANFIVFQNFPKWTESIYSWDPMTPRPNFHELYICYVAFSLAEADRKLQQLSELLWTGHSIQEWSMLMKLNKKNLTLAYKSRTSLYIEKINSYALSAKTRTSRRKVKAWRKRSNRRRCVRSRRQMRRGISLRRRAC